MFLSSVAAFSVCQICFCFVLDLAAFTPQFLSPFFLFSVKYFLLQLILPLWKKLLSPCFKLLSPLNFPIFFFYVCNKRTILTETLLLYLNV